jgi:hypothetical protein
MELLGSFVDSWGKGIVGRGFRLWEPWLVEELAEVKLFNTDAEGIVNIQVGEEGDRGRKKEIIRRSGELGARWGVGGRLYTGH